MAVALVPATILPLHLDQKTRRVTDAINNQYVAVAAGPQDHASYRVAVKFGAEFAVLIGNF